MKIIRKIFVGKTFNEQNICEHSSKSSQQYYCTTASASVCSNQQGRKTIAISNKAAPLQP